VEVLQAKNHKHYVEQHLNSKAEYINTQQGLPV
jgi:hypothetical protein